MTESKTTVSVEDIINQIGAGLFQIINGGLICGISYGVVGIQLLNLSMVIDQYSQHFDQPLTTAQKGLINSIILIGIMAGTLPIGSIADEYGRRTANISLSAIYCIFGVLQVFSWSYYMMLFSRFMIGVGIGAAQSLVFVTSGETTPTNQRALYLGTLNFAYFFGKNLVAPIAYFTADSLGWQIYLLLTSAPGIVAFAGFVFYVPETPQFFMSVGKVDEAKNVLNRIAKVNKKEINGDLMDRLVPQIQQKYQENSNMLQQVYKGLWKAIEVFTAPYLKTSICIMFVWFAHGAGWLSLNLWFISLFQSFVTTLDIHHYWQASICLAVQIPGSIFGIVLVAWMGRKSMLIKLSYVSGIALLFILVSPNNNILVLVCLCVSMAFHCMIWNPLSLLTIELYPTQLRGMACSIAVFFSYFGGFVFSFLTPQLMLVSRLLVLMLPAALFILAALVTLPLRETKGEKLFEIESTASTSLSEIKEDSIMDIDQP
eukprot:TRINITY_DN22916_c0_g1_i1.p1 TRINITY_DN22916_c0_g1~~TRINITY_DN22916_c0_g1_i1.p1  ORF type:complete len:539 (-),score=25.88 TRINITY_DN22916_c0_g1_i1:47-1504(-)